MSTSQESGSRRWLWIAIAVGALLLPFLVEFEGLSVAGHRVFAIFLLAIVLWVSEAIPLHATAALIIFLNILLVSDSALLPLPAGSKIPSYRTYFASLADPVLMLFLGGFFLADGAARFQLDRNLARILLKPFGRKPGTIMLGLMLITALFSMFMSNTATTATMMAVVLPVIVSLPAGDRRKVALALCIPFAANIGGMGTPVGTPPNAIALGALAQAGIPISFVKWMLMIIPTMVVLLFVTWVLLDRLYPSTVRELTLDIRTTFDRSRSAYIFYATFVITVGLWLTEALHGLNSNVIGFFPVVILLGTGIFSVKDLQGVQWHVLWLVAGGIALGSAVSASGLDKWMIGLMPWETMSPAWILAMLALVALALSTVISNSATANLLIPIGMSLGLSEAVQVDRVETAVFIALGASLAMALPISTPPNAIAYATGEVKVRDMAIVGGLVGLVGWLLFVFLAPITWRWLGVIP